MINVTKRVSAAFFAVLLMLCTSICAFAESSQKLIDNADLFTTSEKEELIDSLKDAGNSSGWDVIIYTNNNYMESSEMEDYCNDFYDNHNFGKGSQDSGVMLTIDMGSRKMYILTKGNAKSYFSDERVDAILDAAAGSLQSDNYYEAAKSFINYTLQYYYDDKPSDESFSNIDDEEEQKEDSPALYVLMHYGIIIALVALAIAALCVVFVVLRYKNNGKEGTYDLYANSKTDITEKQDIFLNKSVSVTTVSSSSGSSGRSSGGGSGGSSSHGGGGRSF